jgi:hypothetical protein
VAGRVVGRLAGERPEEGTAGFWTVTGQMANSRGANFGTVVLRDGRVLVDCGSQLFTWCDNEGGECYTEPLRTTEIYTP